MVERLSYAQRRWLEVIARYNDHGEEGHNLEGDLSLASRNQAATHRSLIRRGFLIAKYDETLEPDGAPWLYTITDAGRAALKGDADAR